jgi:hypothetical protein
LQKGNDYTTMEGMRKFMVAAEFILLSFIGVVASTMMADALQSPNYQFNETSLGGIGSLKSQSANFQAASSGGILGINSAEAATMKFDNGHATTNDPGLAFAVSGAATNFGSFSPTTASVATSTFEVANYTSYGYIVQIIGTPPKNGTHTIGAMASAGPSQAGTEQFGINLVANTSPTSVGANPDQGQFGFGTASSNYGTSNNYRFVSGDIIASAPKSSGTTIYTISYLINVSSITQGGEYTADQTIVCTATF